MPNDNTDKQIIGRAEHLNFPEQGWQAVPARIDTGARTSSIWASEVVESDAGLQVVFFGEGSPYYDGRLFTFDEFEPVVVASSNGDVQERFKVRLLVRLGGRKIRAWFTLAERGTQVYPVLIGRNVLHGKFIVDVKQGKVLRDAEKQRTQDLRSRLNDEVKE